MKKIGMLMAALIAVLLIAMPAQAAGNTSGEKSKPPITVNGGGSGGGDGDREPTAD